MPYKQFTKHVDQTSSLIEITDIVFSLFTGVAPKRWVLVKT